MARVARVYKDSVGGGLLISPPTNNSVYVNKYPVAILNQLVSSHFPCGYPGEDEHCHSIVLLGSKTVYVKKQNIVRRGDYTLCSHTISSGSSNVFSN